MSLTMDQSPIYSPLDPSRRQLRLLLLHRGQPDEPIHCSLKSSFISEQEPYEALSYVWGDAMITTPIYIGPLQKTFDVTTNLACVLSHLRYQDKDRTLWVDALCINQSNAIEKSHQVRMMRAIYEGARCVLAWLGPETSGTEAAIQTVELLANDVHLHWRPDGRSDRVGSSITIEQVLGLHTWFRGCDWWTRIWTVQEYAVAQELVFLCGRFSIMRERIEALARNELAHAGCCPPLHPISMDQDNSGENTDYILSEVTSIAKLKSWAGGPSSMCVLAATFRTRHASKPEDKVFGLAGLMDGFDQSLINYETDVAAIYEEFVKFMINATSSLDPLSHVVHQYSVPLNMSFSVATTILPSWVANFKPSISPRLSGVLLQRHRKMKFYNTSGKKFYQASTTRKGLLNVSGVLWDTIALVGAAIDDTQGGVHATTAKSWCQMAGIRRFGWDINPGRTAENAFWRTMCADIVSQQLHHSGPEQAHSWKESRADNSAYRAFKLWWQVIEAIEASNTQPRPNFVELSSVPLEYSAFDEWFYVSTCCRRFFISEKGYIGLAPAIAEQGDRIAVLFGGKVPYILRENKSDSPTTWTFVGDAYVHGIMDGQVIEKLEAGEIESEVITLK